MADLVMPAGTPATPVETVNARDIRVGNRLAIHTSSTSGTGYRFLTVLKVDEDRPNDAGTDIAYRFTTEEGLGLWRRGDVRRATVDVRLDQLPAAEQPPRVGQLPDDVRELLAAVVDALDLPLADRAEDDATRTALLSRRASDARIILDAAIKGDRIPDCTRQLRGWTAEHPATYTVYVPEQVEGEGPR